MSTAIYKIKCFVFWNNLRSFGQKVYVEYLIRCSKIVFIELVNSLFLVDINEWQYIFIVTASDSCPSNSLNVLRSIFVSNERVAKVCLNAWKFNFLIWFSLSNRLNNSWYVLIFTILPWLSQITASPLLSRLYARSSFSNIVGIGTHLTDASDLDRSMIVVHQPLSFFTW